MAGANEIARVGFTAAADTNTLTIPTHVPGDLIIGFAFRDGSTTNPTIGAAGWTTITNTTDGTLCSLSAAWKRAPTNAEAFGTWTNASVVACAVYRNCATNKTPIGTSVFGAGTTGTLSFSALNPLKCAGTSWIVAFAGHRSADTALQTPPTNLTNQATAVGASNEVAGHDSNGPISPLNGWPASTVTLGGTDSGWQTLTVEIFAEQSRIANFMAADASLANAGVISVGERIK